MITGTGIDIIEVARVEEKISKKNGFKEKVFAVNEIEFCEAQVNSSQHYAARFAAKEAFLKATGMGLLAGLDLNEIEIINDARGKPGLLLHGSFKEQALKNNWNLFHVSLTHIQSVACAVVIIEA